MTHRTAHADTPPRRIVVLARRAERLGWQSIAADYAAASPADRAAIEATLVARRLAGHALPPSPRSYAR